MLKVEKGAALLAGGKLTAAKAATTLKLSTVALIAKQAVATKQTSAITAAKFVLTTAMKKAKLAVIGFGKGIKIAMGPIGWIIAAIGLLVAGVIALVNHFRNGGSAARANARELDRLSEAAERSAREYERTQKATDNQANSANRLTDELEALNRQESHSYADRQRMRTLVDQLTSKYGDLNHLIDEEGNLISGSAYELRRYIRERQNAQNFDNAMQRRNDLEEQHIDLLEGQRAAQAEVDRLRSRGQRENSSAMQSALETLDGFNSALADNNAAAQANARTLRYSFTTAGRSIYDLADQWGKTVDDVRDAMSLYGFSLDDMYLHQSEIIARQEADLSELAEHWGKTVYDIVAEMEELGISMEEWAGYRQTQMLSDLGEQWGKTADDVVKSLERQGVSMDDITNLYPALAEATITAALSVDQLMQAYDAAFESALSSINSQIGLFDRLNFESGKAAQDMVYTWRDQAADMARHSENLERAIALGLKPELVDSFSDINQAANLAAMIASIEEGATVMEDGSIQISDEAQTLVSNLNDSFQGANLGREDLAHAIARIQTDFEEGMQYIIETFEYQVRGMDLSKESAASGAATIDGLIQGMENREGAAADAANRLGARVLSEMRRTLQVNSPSRAMKRIGNFTMDGFADGMEDRQKKVEKVAKDYVKTLIVWTMFTDWKMIFAAARKS
jgi:Sec-independent protein translocase protein TatA